MTKSSELPSFHPTSTESAQEIPERFLLDGYLSLTPEGQWLYEDEKVEHPGVLRFLSAQLQRTSEGEYWVVNGPQRVFVKVEGAPFQVVLLEEVNGEFQALLDDGSEELLRLESVSIDEEGTLYTLVKYGKAGDDKDLGHLARLSRQAVYALAQFLEEDEQFYLHLPDRRVTIKPLDTSSLQ